MFQESLVESSSLLHARNRWPAVISFAVQAMIASVLIALPLLHPEVLSLVAPRMMVEAPPLSKPPVLVQPVRVETSSAAAAVAAPMQPARLPSEAFRDNSAAVDRPALPLGVNLAGPGSSPLTALGSVGPGGPHVVAGPAAGTARVRCMFLLE